MGQYARDTLARRLFTKVKIDGQPGCWNFTGCRTHKGYGQIGIIKRGRSALGRAHRVCYEMFNGPIPKPLHHVCENPACVNPAHLRAVTHTVHLRDLTPGSISYTNSRKTHCPRGHLLAGENLSPAGLARGRRYCRTCGNAQSLMRYHARQARRAVS